MTLLLLHAALAAAQPGPAGHIAADARPGPPPLMLTAQSRPPEPPASRSRARPARITAGWISASDYPAGALRSGAEGQVTVRYVIGRDGEVESCDVVGTSGNAELDLVSCAIVAQRFVFDPARDARGRRVTNTRTQRIVWRLPEPAPAAPAAPQPPRT